MINNYTTELTVFKEWVILFAFKIFIHKRGISMNKLRKLLLIIFGNMMYSFAIAYFIIPSGLITGGTTGIALFINYLHPIDISTFVLIFNIVMFIIGYFVLGKVFALTTIISSIAYPSFIKLFQMLSVFTGMITDDILICTLFGGALIGVGIGIVIKSGASTGGMDIPLLILQKKTGIQFSISIYVSDICILLTQAFFSNRNQILYGILLVCTYSIALDKVLVLGKSKTQVEIISEKYEEINSIITSRFDRGCTLYEVEGGYTRNETYAVLSVVNKREVFQLQEAIMAIDPTAFIIISQVNEVKGRGFTLNKVYDIESNEHRTVQNNSNNYSCKRR